MAPLVMASRLSTLSLAPPSAFEPSLISFGILPDGVVSGFLQLAFGAKGPLGSKLGSTDLIVGTKLGSIGVRRRSWHLSRASCRYSIGFSQVRFTRSFAKMAA